MVRSSAKESHRTHGPLSCSRLHSNQRHIEWRKGPYAVKVSTELGSVGGGGGGQTKIQSEIYPLFKCVHCIHVFFLTHVPCVTEPAVSAPAGVMDHTPHRSSTGCPVGPGSANPHPANTTRREQSFTIRQSPVQGLLSGSDEMHSRHGRASSCSTGPRSPWPSKPDKIFTPPNHHTHAQCLHHR